MAVESKVVESYWRLAMLSFLPLKKGGGVRRILTYCEGFYMLHYETHNSIDFLQHLLRKDLVLKSRG